MRAAFFPLVAIVLGAAPARAEPAVAYAPVLLESRYFSGMPRDPATTQDINIDRNLIGNEAPASVDIYALTEDGRDETPVVSIERRIGYVPLHAWRPRYPGQVLRVRG